EAVELRRRTSRLIRAMKPETLRRLLEMGGDFAQRQRFALDATHGMAVDAVLEIVRAAADTSSQSISHSLVRMLSKLAAHAEQGARLASLLDLLEGAPAGSAVEAVWARVATPAAVRRVLEGAPIDFRSLDRLLGRVGLEAADLLLDFLATAEERAVRRALLDRLVTLGAVLGPRLAARLGDERWYVVRNLLWMLDRLPALPPDFSPGPFSAHADARVRREALKLRLKVLAEREAALHAALQDPDEQAVRLGLIAAQQDCPPNALPLVVD